MSWDITEYIASCWIGDKKYIDKLKTWFIYCVKDNVYIWMPMPVPMLMPRCRCQNFQMAIIFFSIDLKVWGYPTLLLLISWFINFKGSEISAGFHYRSLILGVSCLWLINLNVYQWPNEYEATVQVWRSRIVFREERIQICFSVALRVLIKKKWVGNRRKRFYSEMQCMETPFEVKGFVKIR